MVLTPQVVNHVNIPVIASGGIVDGRGLMVALALGAEGIEMGTRFIATKECVNAHGNYKQAIVDADEHSTVVVKRSIGAPARAIKGVRTEQILEIEKENQGYESLKDYISGEANKRFAHDGDERKGFGWAEQGATRINDIPAVEHLIATIIEEANGIKEKWQ